MNFPAIVASETEVLTRPELESIEDSDSDFDVPWNVVLLDDDFHSYDYVVEMLCEIFGYSIRKSLRLTIEVDTRKRVILWSGHRELAEMYQEKIHEYGPDWRMDTSRGSMSCVLERAR